MFKQYLKQYLKFLAETKKLMLIFVLLFVALQMFLYWLSPHIPIPKAIAEDILIFTALQNVFSSAVIMLLSVPITGLAVSVLLCENKYSGGYYFKKWYLPSLAYNIATGLITFAGYYPLMHGKHDTWAAVWTFAVSLALVKFAIWMQIGMREELSFKAALISSWKRLSFWRSILIVICSIIPGMLIPVCNFFLELAKAPLMPGLFVQNAVIGLTDYLIILILILFYWKIIEDEKAKNMAGAGGPAVKII